MHRPFHPALAAVVAACTLCLVPSMAAAQRRPTSGQTTAIEIRGTVPTPQVVTVRPRETPQYSRQVLVPQYYDRSFWPSVFPAYQLVAARQIAGAALAGAGTAPGVPGLELELEALRRDLEYRRARLDSLAAVVKNLGAPRPTPPQGKPQALAPVAPAPADTTRQPPKKIPPTSRQSR